MRILLVAALVAAGCGSKGAGGHCRLGNTCEDQPAGDLAAAEKECKALTGEWSTGTCPSADEIGSCATGQTTRHYYGGGTNAYTKDNASANCEHELHGTWTAR